MTPWCPVRVDRRHPNVSDRPFQAFPPSSEGRRSWGVHRMTRDGKRLECLGVKFPLSGLESEKMVARIVRMLADRRFIGGRTAVDVRLARVLTPIISSFRRSADVRVSDCSERLISRQRSHTSGDPPAAPRSIAASRRSLADLASRASPSLRANSIAGSSLERISGD